MLNSNAILRKRLFLLTIQKTQEVTKMVTPIAALEVLRRTTETAIPVRNPHISPLIRLLAKGRDGAQMTSCGFKPKKKNYTLRRARHSQESFQHLLQQQQSRSRG